MTRLLLILMISVSFIACKNDASQGEKSGKTVADISNTDFNVECSEADMKGNVPEVKMYFTSPKLNEKVFITTTPACRDLSGNYLDYNMPKEAIFKVSGYYAGGGFYYYGQVEGNKLKVYRTFIEEPRPEGPDTIDPAQAQYQEYMTVTIYEDGSTEIERMEKPS